METKKSFININSELAKINLSMQNLQNENQSLKKEIKHLNENQNYKNQINQIENLLSVSQQYKVSEDDFRNTIEEILSNK